MTLYYNRLHYSGGFFKRFCVKAFTEIQTNIHILFLDKRFERALLLD